MRFLTTLSATLVLGSQVAVAATAQIDFSPNGFFRTVTAEEVGDQDGPPPGWRVFELVITTDADILRIGDVFIRSSPQGADLYNHPLGSDMAPPNPAFEAVFPALGADSWITTPGANTSTAGGSLGEENVSWFDTTNDGPVSDFLFARLTTSDGLQFSGVVSLAGETGPELFPFNIFTPFIPEPSAILLLATSVSIVLLRRSYRPRTPAPTSSTITGV